MIQKKSTRFLLLLLSCQNIFTLSQQETEKIGQQIWHNEASGKEELLVFWNQHEAFPSLGIGHTIWPPAGSDVPYTSDFPALCDYFKKNDVVLPAWLEQSKGIGAPWQSRQEFYDDHERTQELRQLLVKTVGLQTQFMIDRVSQQLPNIIEATPVEKREQITKQIDLLLSIPQGTYTLVDYLNFKGAGLSPKEENNGQRWGLLPVLLDMPDNLTQENVTKAFAVSAAKKLLMRIENSAPDYKYIIFLHGWMKRISTYFSKENV